MTRADQHATGTKGQRRRQEILDSAQDLFARQGYEHTTTQDIADAAGILKGSLYYYFGSKEELLFSVLLRTQGELTAHVVERFDYSTVAPLEAVGTFIRRHVEWVLDHGAVAALYGQQSAVVRRVEEWWTALAGARQQYEDALLTIIRRASGLADSGVDEESVLTTRALLSMANGSRQWFHTNGSLTRQHVAEHHALFAMRGLGSPR